MFVWSVEVSSQEHRAILNSQAVIAQHISVTSVRLNRHTKCWYRHSPYTVQVKERDFPYTVQIKERDCPYTAHGANEKEELSLNGAY